MKNLRMIAPATIAAVALMAVFASATMATVVTSPAGTTYTGTFSLQSANLEFHGEAFSVSCSGSTMTGKIDSHGTGATAKGSLSSFTMTSCNYPMTVLTRGSLEIHTDASGNGTVTWRGLTLTTHGPFGINCIYETRGTHFGTLTGSKTTGETAKIDVDSALIPRTGHSAFCGENAEWTGSYTVTTPDYLDVD